MICITYEVNEAQYQLVNRHQHHILCLQERKSYNTNFRVEGLVLQQKSVMEQKKKCGCNIKHKSQAAWIKCFRANVDPSYGNKKKQKDVQVKPHVDPEMPIQPIQANVMCLRSRQVEKCDVPQNILQSARQLFNGNRSQAVDDIERRKNVLWLNAIAILRVRGNHCSSLKKAHQIKRLMKYRQIYWHAIENYIESKTVLAKHADRNLAQADLDAFWEEFRVRNERNESIFRDLNICDFMSEYYDYCIQEDFLLGQYDSFTGRFHELARFILPMTPFRFNVLLKRNWQLYCIYRGKGQESMESFTSFLKNDAVKKYLKDRYSYRVFKKDRQYAEAQQIINRIFITAWYKTSPLLVKQATLNPHIWKSFMRDITVFRERIALRNRQVFMKQQQIKRQQTGFYDEENNVTIHIAEPKITFDLPMRNEPEIPPAPQEEKVLVKIEETSPLNLTSFPKPTQRAIGQTVRIESRFDRTLRLQKNFDAILMERKARQEEEARKMLKKKKK